MTSIAHSDSSNCFSQQTVYTSVYFLDFIEIKYSRCSADLIHVNPVGRQSTIKMIFKSRVPAKIILFIRWKPKRNDTFVHVRCKFDDWTLFCLKEEYHWHRTPVVTGSSIAAFVFNGGVILAADVLGSYGSLAKYRNFPRIHQVNDQTILALGGDLSDGDYIKEAIDSKV